MKNVTGLDHKNFNNVLYFEELKLFILKPKRKPINFLEKFSDP